MWPKLQQQWLHTHIFDGSHWLPQYGKKYYGRQWLLTITGLGCPSMLFCNSHTHLYIHTWVKRSAHHCHFLVRAGAGQIPHQPTITSSLYYDWTTIEVKLILHISKYSCLYRMGFPTTYFDMKNNACNISFHCNVTSADIPFHSNQSISTERKASQLGVSSWLKCFGGHMAQ